MFQQYAMKDMKQQQNSMERRKERKSSNYCNAIKTNKAEGADWEKQMALLQHGARSRRCF